MLKGKLLSAQIMNHPGFTAPDAAHHVMAAQIYAIIKKPVLHKTIPAQRIDEPYRRIVALKAKYP